MNACRNAWIQFVTVVGQEPHRGATWLMGYHGHPAGQAHLGRHLRLPQHEDVLFRRSASTR
eukprot:15481945-Alexandrium_andersonii.AAC.1